MPAAATPADRLLAAIERLGISKAEAARRLGTTRESLAQYLDGSRIPTLSWLDSFALALGIDPHELDDRLSPLRLRRSGKR